MTSVTVQYKGLDISIFKSSHNTWICPVCGYSELTSMPYNVEGLPTFTMCTLCMFEFGFDDDPDASGEASGTVIESWNKYRRNYLKEISNDTNKLQKVKKQLNAIGIDIDEVTDQKG